MSYILVLILGVAIGIVLMCLLQINRDNSKDKQIKELKDEIEMQELNECNLGGYCLQNTCKLNWKNCQYLNKDFYYKEELQ